MPIKEKLLSLSATLLWLSLAGTPETTEASSLSLQTCPAGEGGEKGTIIVEGSSVRSGPTSQSERIEYLRYGTPLTVVGVQDGELVSQLGKSDDDWDRVRLENCTEGFVWAPLIETGEKKIYNKLVFDDCPYQTDNIFKLEYRDYERRETFTALEINSVLVFLNSWKGRNIWLGYPDEVPEGTPSGFDMPEEAKKIGTIKLTLKENIVNGQKVFNDYTEIWLFRDDNEVYVLPFVSLTVEFSRADGEYSGYHLCGAYAVPIDLVDGITDLFKSA